MDGRSARRASRSAPPAGWPTCAPRPRSRREMRTAVVTGASSGIGAATARALATAGFQVFLGARRQDRLQEVADTIGSSATALPLDVTDEASVESFASQLPESLHLLVNNAGG